MLEIGKKACYLNTKIITITIPESVVTIRSEAFYKAKSLKTIKIKSTKLKRDEKNAIKGINKKAQIEVPQKKLKAYKKLFKKKTGFKKGMIIK